MKVAIFGVGGLGRELYVLLRQYLEVNAGEYEFVGWYDDSAELGTSVLGYPVLGGMEQLNKVDEEIGIFMGLGDPRVKKLVLGKISNQKISFPNLIHPEVRIEEYQDIKLGQGVVIQQGTILTTNINLEDHVFLNLTCTVGHDTNIGMYTSFMPGVNISGDCDIADGVYFGTNATLINALKVGSGAVIGAGACVSKHIEDNTVNVGIPSKSIKELPKF